MILISWHGLRRGYDQAVAFGISVNLSRPWHKGNHPGLILARRLKRKASQVWLFATRFDVPATNNGSENAVSGYKLAAKISGCWRTLATLRRHCRIRSYLTTARSHGHHPLAAIRDALNGNLLDAAHPQHDQLARHPVAMVTLARRRRQLPESRRQRASRSRVRPDRRSGAGKDHARDA